MTPNFSRSLSLLQPPRIVLGAGSALAAAAEFGGAGRRSVIITTSSVLEHAARLAAAVRQAGGEVEIILEGAQEPTIATCTVLLEKTRAARPDVVLAVGGGSVLDAAKLAAALHECEGPVTAYVGSGLVPPRRTRLACFPTTAGTGSEVSPNALLLDEQAQAKKAVISPYLVPDLAVVDPELTRTLPAPLTATTGIDALAHCLEAYASAVAHPAVDLYALEGVRLIAHHLPRAVACGEDLEARSAVALGSLYGGLCLGPVNTNGVHALAYPLGGEYHLPHALSIALMLPHVVAFNCSALPERHAALAHALGEPQSGNVVKDAAALPLRLHALLDACRLPLGLSRHGVSRDAVPRLADAGLLVTRLLKNNPRPVSREDAVAILEAAF